MDFETTERKELLTVVRDAALRDARDRAEATAAVLGQRLGSPITIERPYFGSRQQFQQTHRKMNWVSPKHLKVEATVKVTFALESP